MVDKVSSHPRVIDDILDIASNYQVFLFDQYGVLHDGQRVYPGMTSCLRALKSQGKSVAVLSNSGKRASYNQDRLQSFGYDQSLIDAVFTSGEVAWLLLNNYFYESQTRPTVFYVGRGGDRSAIAGLPIVETLEPVEADVVLITGNEPERLSLDQYCDCLQHAAERHVVAYCTNPDRWSLVGGELMFGPGQIAERYQAMGGELTWIGKPYGEIYNSVLTHFECDAASVIGIGDSLEHDIAGARAAGCASLLTATGILQELNQDQLTRLFDKTGVQPDYLIRRS